MLVVIELVLTALVPSPVVAAAPVSLPEPPLHPARAKTASALAAISLLSFPSSFILSVFPGSGCSYGTVGGLVLIEGSLAHGVPLLEPHLFRWDDATAEPRLWSFLLSQRDLEQLA